MNEPLKEAKKYTKICIDDLKHSHLPNEQWSIEDAVTLENLKWIWRALEALEALEAEIKSPVDARLQNQHIEELQYDNC